MNEQLRKLLDLQKIDADLIFLRKLKDERPKELESERRKVRKAEAGVAAVQDAIKQLRMECDKGELDVKQKQAEIEKLQIALNTSKSNQEYQVLKDQIERYRGQSGEIEERVLEKMSKMDALSEEKKMGEQSLAAARGEFAEREAEMAGLLGEIDGKIRGLEEQRAANVAAIDPEALDLYEKVLERYSDSALALVENKVCQGCHMSVTTQAVSELMMGGELVQCKYCLRILHLH